MQSLAWFGITNAFKLLTGNYLHQGRSKLQKEVRIGSVQKLIVFFYERNCPKYKDLRKNIALLGNINDSIRHPTFATNLTRLRFLE